MRKEYFAWTVLIGVVGFITALFADACSMIHAKQSVDTIFLGVPMFLIGVLGYALIFVTAYVTLIMESSKFFAVVNHGLVVFTGLFTIFLIWKAVHVEMLCPACIICWILNIILVVRLAGFITDQEGLHIS
ncbi:MAG TPA: hypothetical protein DEB09_00550 [Candidatus Magasanikbacteria bacterium]|nr:hypothetical protein [Candidatus Magasanikbacteria bacterium]